MPVKEKHDPVFRVRIMPIVEAVAKYYGLIPEQLLKPKQHTKSIKTARKVAMYLVWDRLHFSEPEMGYAFGVDRTSCRLAVLSVVEGRKVSESLANSLKQITFVLNSTQSVLSRFSPKAIAALQEVVDTGLFGDTIEEVIVRLTTDRLFQLTRKEVKE